MQYNFLKGMIKGVLVFVYVLAGFLVQTIAEALTGYKPSPETPAYIAAAWNAIVPSITAGLIILANYLKMRAVK